ncbi:hypothetical protein [Streptomyces sp. SID3343]|uniref:hypothetical protein n=1 Tax=Streptomyces sp. SID3343 TaxID=2690260 RepID=UPI00136E1AF9|nr:hypothetical protein [Streptomyces sp. SID3343]MYW00073.1 hypothetical protein [Streptomyces sp. SID3343]
MTTQRVAPERKGLPDPVGGPDGSEPRRAAQNTAPCAPPGPTEPPTEQPTETPTVMPPQAAKPGRAARLARRFRGGRRPQAEPARSHDDPDHSSELPPTVVALLRWGPPI